MTGGAGPGVEPQRPQPPQPPQSRQPARIDRAKVAAARLWAATRFPYLATALFASPIVARPGIEAIAVDEHWRLYVDPAVVDRWPVEALGSVFVHHTGHLLREHAARARALGIERQDQARWVTAADAEINDDLLDAGLELPQPPVLPDHFGCEHGKMAEEYFAALPARRCQSGECGSGSDGCEREWDEGGGGEDGLSAYSADLLRCQVAGECLRQGKQAGTVPAGLMRWAQAVLSAKVDWRRVLAAELRRGLNDVSGAVDYSYRRPSRRSGSSAGVILPALRRPVPEVAIVCDTSGSMTDDLLAEALAEVQGILRGVGVRDRGVRVLACDVVVHAARRVASASQVELVGGGGTDMGAGIAAAARGHPRPGVIVVLTDGYTPWPPEPPKGCTVVVGLLGIDSPPAPGWARSVRIEDLGATA
jgi:predicted metal-dependent peptidase